jgi:hypothetical protein
VGLVCRETNLPAQKSCCTSKLSNSPPLAPSITNTKPINCHPNHRKQDNIFKGKAKRDKDRDTEKAEVGDCKEGSIIDWISIDKESVFSVLTYWFKTAIPLCCDSYACVCCGNAEFTFSELHQNMHCFCSSPISYPDFCPFNMLKFCISRRHSRLKIKNSESAKSGMCIKPNWENLKVFWNGWYISTIFELKEKVTTTRVTTTEGQLLFFFFHRKKVVEEAEQKVKKKKKRKVGVMIIPDKQGGVFDFQDTCVGEDSTVLSLEGSIS